jgi:AraC-like DNA-binding protein
VRELCGSGWEPAEVLIPHSAPRDARHYRNLFHVLPRFDSEYAALRFRASWMDRPVLGADRERRRQAEENLAACAPSLLQHVYRALRVQLLMGECSGNNVASALTMHRRTLNRRLQEQGTTFQHCLDQVRFEVACQLLSTSHVSLDDVAATLGYASVSPFMRTFRRWSGTTPAQWRRAFVVGERTARVHAVHG